MHTFAILYVEDEESDVLLMQMAFDRVGVANPLKSVSDGKQAIDYLAGNGMFADRSQYPLPGLVLLDIKLPMKSGFDVLTWLREQPALKLLPVVMHTSSDQAQDIERAYALGANGYMTKSSSPQEWAYRAAAIRDFWLVCNTLPPRLFL